MAHFIAKAGAQRRARLVLSGADGIQPGQIFGCHRSFRTMPEARAEKCFGGSRCWIVIRGPRPKGPGDSSVSKCYRVAGAGRRQIPQALYLSGEALPRKESA